MPFPTLPSMSTRRLSMLRTNVIQQTPIRELTAQPMDQTLIALLLDASHRPTHLPRSEAKQSRRLLLQPLALDDAIQHLRPIPLSTTHLDPLAFLGSDRHGTSLPAGKKAVLSLAKKRTFLLS